MKYFEGYKWFNGYVTNKADARYLNQIEGEFEQGLITANRKHAITCMVIGEVACNNGKESE